MRSQWKKHSDFNKSTVIFTPFIIAKLFAMPEWHILIGGLYTYFCKIVRFTMDMTQLFAITIQLIETQKLRSSHLSERA